MSLLQIAKHPSFQNLRNLVKMEALAGSQSMLLFMSTKGKDIVLKPEFSRGFSGLLHVLLLIVLIGIWGWRRIMATGQRPELKLEISSYKFGCCYKMVLALCLCLSGTNLLLGLLSYFYWYKNGWFDLKVAVLLDFGARTLAWFGLFGYLKFQCKRELPFLLRTWWGFYSFISCYCLVVDVVDHRKIRALPLPFMALDFVSVVAGLFLCCVGFVRRIECEEPDHLEPLLNGTGSIGNCEDSDKSKGVVNQSPFSTAGVFSIMSFSWVGPLIAAGNKKIIDLEDVPQLDSVDSVSGTFPYFKSQLESNSGNGDVTTFKLVKALVLSSKGEIIRSGFLALAYTFASYVGPYLIDNFVQYLSGKRGYKNEGYVLVLTFFLAKLVECLCQRHWFFGLQQIGVRIRAELITLIYNKGLTLSCKSKQGQTSGEIINFMTVDAERIGDFSWYVHDPWLVVLQVGLALVILYKNLGVAAVAALISTVVVMVLNFPLGKVQENFQEKLMKSKDKRMKATSEILRNMRILKLQGWEMNFLSKIIELRRLEAGWLKKYLYTSSLTTFLFYGAPTFVSVAAFGTCMFLGIPLQTGKILSALATFRILQIPIYNLPDTVSMIIQTKVSLDRLSGFLRLDDLPPDVVERLPKYVSDYAIEIINGNFSWDVTSSNPTLEDINIKVSHGMRVAVCGTVGSGKSSLLSCILGEMPKVSGTIKLSGTKVYVAQSPWIQSGKIQDNILFGKDMDRERYDMVLDVCSLKKDLEILSFGDQTVIGERGINLSGGQKQRIQIARALYQDADIYLFDDPFSAVDAHTGTHLFKECILGLLGSKTVIYVTHQVEFLPAADLIMVMKGGRITQSGKYNDILNSGPDFIELVGAHNKALSALDSFEAGASSGNLVISEEGKPFSGQKSKEENDPNSKSDDTGLKAQLVQDEERKKGKVGFDVYWKFIRTAYGGALVPLILLTQTLFQILQIASNYWMAWATPLSEDVKPPVTGFTLIYVYVGLAVGSSFCVLIRALLLVTAGYKTATILFNKMHECIFRASMSFFDSTPSGRILNRASTDQSAVDLSIAYQIATFTFSMIQLMGIIGVMSQVAWQVFIVFIPVIAASIWCQQYYISTARELARLVGVCKAPVIQHFAETISGSMTIRSFDQGTRFQDTNMQLMDGYSRPKFYVAAAMEWLCFRLNMLSIITFAFSLVFLVSIPAGVISPSLAGLAITYGLNLNMLQASVIWNLCNLESKIISVERIFQYTNIKSEPPLFIEGSRPDTSWPSNGEIKLWDLKVRYAPHMPLVLRGLTCTFHGGMKTGIVGRTGSGKSTLIQTLFRLVEPSAGIITIDGINISTIGLHDLRSRISIIPQDPTMFEGTVRSNLDPLEEYKDEEIWEALDKCQLGDEVRKKDGKLDSTVSENGENWSMGQRQLVCLGRVLLKKSKVLVLDEATASVDTATDNLIQETLRHHFAHSTVITIAHRITSVLDSDMVLLLDYGLIAEYDTPSNLLENKASAFAQLVAEYSARSSSGF
ncbi:unnamed protein product [Rhodiola kirilowii]